MNKYLLFIFTLFCCFNAKSQSLNLSELIRFSESEKVDIQIILQQKGWEYYYTKNNANFKSFIWYFDGIKKSNSISPNGIEVSAQYWIKKVISNSSNYKAIDYECKYNVYVSLIKDRERMNLKYVGSNRDSQRDYDSYTDGVNKIDFIRYLDGKGYGVIIHTNF